jgi:molybdenum cofactor cytidylyltransferase
LSSVKVAALVLAAGYSSRMGEFKPLLPLGRSTAIERAVGSFREAGVRDVRVVVGYRAEEITPILARLGAQAVFNVHYDAGMYSSVVAGVGSLSRDTGVFFLLPGDSPLVKPRTVRELLRAWGESRAGIIYPCFLGRRGHPPLISTTYVETILAGERPGGLRAVLARHEDAALDVEVTDQGVLIDVDTPADYQKALAYSLREDIPTEEECRAILGKLKVPQEVIAHSRLMADVSCRLAALLNRAGCNLNLDLVIAAGLLHDLAKGQPDHARAGAEMLREMAYPRVAEVVASHMDISPEQPLNEAQIAYLADKFTEGTRLVPLAERRRASLERLAAQPAALEAAAGRFRNAEIIEERVEAVLGLPLEQALFDELSERVGL